MKWPKLSLHYCKLVLEYKNDKNAFLAAVNSGTGNSTPLIAAVFCFSFVQRDLLGHSEM